jgi:hypothetical protein
MRIEREAGELRLEDAEGSNAGLGRKGGTPYRAVAQVTAVADLSGTPVNDMLGRRASDSNEELVGIGGPSVGPGTVIGLSQETIDGRGRYALQFKRQFTSARKRGTAGALGPSGTRNGWVPKPLECLENPSSDGVPSRARRTLHNAFQSAEAQRRRSAHLAALATMLDGGWSFQLQPASGAVSMQVRSFPLWSAG